MMPLAANLDSIAEKVQRRERLTAEDGLVLLNPQTDLHVVGELADRVRREQHGSAAWYNINAHLNPTNVCVYRCRLCAYSCDPDSSRAQVMSRDEILARGQEANDAGCTEVHIVGGAHPDLPYRWYRDVLSSLHEAFPRLHLKAWTAVEIAHFAEISGRPVAAVLEDMIEAGLGSLPGGGAEILDDQVRARVCPRKANSETWLEVHRTAHRMGLRSNASMLYGHVETARQRIAHMVRLRDLQDETGGFQAFIPLAFHPDGTQLDDLRRSSSLEDLRVMAVSRLMLDNFPHLKAYWISLGVGTAQVALAYGADDLDGTVRHEAIHHEAGSQAPECLSVETLRALIREAGREPIERDTLYRPVLRPA